MGRAIVIHAGKHLKWRTDCVQWHYEGNSKTGNFPPQAQTTWEEGVTLGAKKLATLDPGLLFIPLLMHTGPFRPPYQSCS